MAKEDLQVLIVNPTLPDHYACPNHECPVLIFGETLVCPGCGESPEYAVLDIRYGLKRREGRHLAEGTPTEGS